MKETKVKNKWRFFKASKFIKSNYEEDKINNSKPESVNDSDNLIAISDPKIAPNEPPAIIKPYSFLDLLSLNKLITNTQNIETTKKAYI